jgi:hypothetical protein
MGALRFGTEGRQGFAACKEKIAAYPTWAANTLIRLNIIGCSCRGMIEARPGTGLLPQPWKPAAMRFLDGPDMGG